MIEKRFGDLIVFVVVVYYFLAAMCILSSCGDEEDATERSNKDEEEVNNATMTCNTNGTNCTCPLDPITAKYADPADPTCVWHYLCHMGVPFRRKCDVRFAFHPVKHMCLPRSQLPFNICKSAVECTTDGYLPDPFDCTKYYLCFYRQPYHYGCNYDNYYDKPKGRCILNKTYAETCKPAFSAPEEIMNIVG